MKEILSDMHGMLIERAIVKGMKSENRHYNFGEYEVKCWVNISEEKIETRFAVFTTYFQDWNKAIYTTNSFKELREWLQDNIENIN